MGQTHWKKLKTNNNYFGAYMLEPDKDLIVTIKDVKKGEVVGENGEKADGTLVYFNEYDKPMILNTTNAKAITTAYKTPYVENWVGKKIQLYALQIRAFGEYVDALRVRKWNPCVCGKCSKLLQPYDSMTIEQLAIYTSSRYKMPLCADCATKLSGKNAT